MPPLALLLILAGFLLLLGGLFLTFGGQVPFIGKLPGDFIIRRGNFTLSLPLGTSVLLSLLLTLILRFIARR